MSLAKSISPALKEIRLHLCQSSPSSSGLRSVPPSLEARPALPPRLSRLTREATSAGSSSSTRTRRSRRPTRTSRCSSARRGRSSPRPTPGSVRRSLSPPRSATTVPASPPPPRPPRLRLTGCTCLVLLCRAWRRVVGRARGPVGGGGRPDAGGAHQARRRALLKPGLAHPARSGAGPRQAAGEQLRIDDVQ